MSDLGLTIFHEGGENPLVDIVAVHGLGGNSHRTWTHKNGCLWLRDLLYLDIPQARIMAFGYNADVFSSNITTAVEYASLLLTYLQAKRQDEASDRARNRTRPCLLYQKSSRPIIFIGHSLGGLVIKKALLHHENAEAAKAVCKATIAIVFMGTPHRGAPIAEKGELLVKFVKTLGVKATEKNISQLREGSPFVHELCVAFGSLLQREKRITVITCFETSAMQIGGQIVPKGSAILGFGEPREKILPINGDHRQIAQFASRSDSQYVLVMGELCRIISEHQETFQRSVLLERKHQTEELRAWLRTARSSLALKKMPASGTCAWVQEKQPFREWINARGPSQLWIHGRPGAGKTVLSHYIAILPLLNENTAALIHISCNACRSNNLDAHYILRQILTQALSAPKLQDAAIQGLLELRNTSLSSSEVSIGRLLDTTNTLLDQCSSTCLIIDGLDECEMDSAESQEFLRWLCTLHLRSSCNIKILMVSRDVPTIRTYLADGPQIEVEKSDTLPDIAKSVEMRVSQIRHLRDRADLITREITQNSNGLFLWADLALNELEKMSNWKEISRLLSERSCDLRVTYSNIMNRLERSSANLSAVRQRSLQMVACAFRSLEIRELEELLAIRPTSLEIDPDNRLEDGWDTIRQACGPMLHVVGNEVELLHFSAKEFILTDIKIGIAPSAYTEEAHSTMASTCLTYLCLSSLDKIKTCTLRHIALVAEQYPFLEYASLYWFEHLAKSRNLSVTSVNLLEHFISSAAGTRWLMFFFPQFCAKRGETALSVFRAVQSVIVQGKRCVRHSELMDPEKSQTVINALDRFLSRSAENCLQQDLLVYGKAAACTVEKMLNVAECQLAQNQLESSKAMAAQAFEISSTTFGVGDPLTLRIEHHILRMEMKVLYQDSNRPAQVLAEKLGDLAARMSNIVGHDHVDALCCQHDFGVAFLLDRRWVDVECVLEPVYEKMKKHLGLTSRITHMTMNNLAISYYYQGKLEKAEELLKSYPDVARVASETLIDVWSLHAYTLESLSLLAGIASARGEHQRSIKLHSMTIDGLFLLQGPRCMKVYESALNIGLALRKQYHLTQAWDQYDAWFTRAKDVFGEKSTTCRKFAEQLELLEADLRDKGLSRSQPSFHQPRRGPEAYSRGRDSLYGFAFLVLILVLLILGLNWHHSAD